MVSRDLSSTGIYDQLGFIINRDLWSAITWATVWRQGLLQMLCSFCPIDSVNIKLHLRQMCIKSRGDSNNAHTSMKQIPAGKYMHEQSVNHFSLLRSRLSVELYSAQLGHILTNTFCTFCCLASESLSLERLFEDFTMNMPAASKWTTCRRQFNTYLSLTRSLSCSSFCSAAMELSSPSIEEDSLCTFAEVDAQIYFISMYFWTSSHILGLWWQ